MDLTTNGSTLSKQHPNNSLINHGNFHLDIVDLNANDSKTIGTAYKNKDNIDGIPITNNKTASEGNEVYSEVKKKRYNIDKGYFMVKELLSTERTYNKDLDVINKVSFFMPDFLIKKLMNYCKNGSLIDFFYGH